MSAEQAAAVSIVLRGASRGGIPAALGDAAAAYVESVYFEAKFGRNADSTAATDEHWAAFEAFGYSPDDVPKV